MRKRIGFWLVAALSLPARAADKPILAPPPAWVRIAPSVADGKDDGAAVRLLLQDQQIAFEHGRKIGYSETILKIQASQGLDAGNVRFSWNPEIDTPTVHKLVIRRGDKVIDVLASQSFTVLRREQNLENAMLDGVLTATLQPEGLQVGDIVDFALSIASANPALGDHVEQIGGGWNSAPVGRAHLGATWPKDLPIRYRQSEGLPPLKIAKDGPDRGLELSAVDMQPLLPPNGAPFRYRLTRLVEMTDLPTWAAAGALLAPLYRKAAVLPPSGPLRDELTRIRSASIDPKARAEAALALVEDRVRYVFLGMDSGDYVPADAATTWSRRFGDCKAKTALLLALLDGLGIEALAVAVSTTAGDGMDQHLPMIGLFDHVLVRAVIGGRTYWLDGTRVGDRALDQLKTPNFRWGLPLLASGADLVPIVPPPLDVPTVTSTVAIDASAGISIPAPIQVTDVLSGDAATAVKLQLASLAPAVRDQALQGYWRNRFATVDIDKVDAHYDPATGEQRLTMTGKDRLKWKDGWFETDGTALGWEADFHRDPGLHQDAPFAVAYPVHTRNTETILLPPGFQIGRAKTPVPLSRTIAGVEYRRQFTIVGNSFTVESSQRSIVPEFPASEAVAAQAELRKLADDRVYLHRPANYYPTDQEMAAAMAQTPPDAAGYVTRGNDLLNRNRLDEGIADFTRALALDPRNVTALTGRGMAYAQKGGQSEAAAKDFDAAAAIDGRNATVYRGRALLAMARNASKDAIAALTTSLEIDPGNTYALGQRASLYFRAGDLAHAEADARRLVKETPLDVEARLLLINIVKNKPDDALIEVKAMTTAMPDNGYAHVAAARSYAALGRREEAMKEIVRALAIKPQAYIYLNRSEIRPKADFAGRKADLALALQLEPGEPDALAAGADLQERQGDWKGAVATWSKAFTVQPTAEMLLYRRGIAELRAGDADAARKDFAAARAKAKSAAALNALCWTSATAGVDLDQALADCDAALKLEPTSPQILDSRGFVLMRLGRNDEAITALSAALALRPDLAPTLMARAVAEARKGDTGAARRDYDAALKQDPEIGARFADYGILVSPGESGSLRADIRPVGFAAD